MGFFSSAWKAVKKAVKQVTHPISTVAHMLGASSSGGSETVELNYAPPINSPIGLGDSPEVGNDSEGHVRKKKGKSRLRITTNGDDSRASRGSGLNI